MRTRSYRIELKDVSNSEKITIKRNDEDYMVRSVIWYPVASKDIDPNNNFPNQVQLAGELAKHAADLSLHHYDISFCGRVLKEYGSRLSAEYSDLLVALWIAVLTKFMSCFQNSKARRRLHPDKVYRANTKALKDFEYINALRNKHIAHDENNHYDAATFAWLEQDGDVEGVGSMILVTRIDAILVAAMHNLVEGAQQYIQSAIEDAGKALFAEVQRMTPEARAALPKSMLFPIPSEADITKTRWVRDA
jgi:hypothetical protein